jgi:hypothetical protein
VSIAISSADRGAPDPSFEGNLNPAITYHTAGDPNSRGNGREHATLRPRLLAEVFLTRDLIAWLLRVERQDGEAQNEEDAGW